MAVEKNAQSQVVAELAQALRDHPRILRLNGGVQHYAWGDREAIPNLLGTPNTDGQPYAELWIGAHPSLPAQVEFDGAVALDRLIAAAPEALLGKRDAQRFDGQLPFLLKILAARVPLSIQVHPDKHQAERGFERENQEGPPLDDPQRNYHDANHKPELICALTPFYALRGFRPLEEIAELLSSVPELRPVSEDFRPTGDGLAAWYRKVMKMESAKVDAVLTPLIDRLRREAAQRPFPKERPEYWVLQADETFSVGTHKDRGLFSVFVLNLLRLEPGQAMFLPAGELHAYLKGTGVEIMANSNNVLRGGLTPKHVDVDELLKIVRFSGGKPDVISPDLSPTAAGQVCYHTSVTEFDLSRLFVTPSDPYKVQSNHSIQLAIVTEGELTATTATGDQQRFDKGQSYLVPQGLSYTLTTAKETVVFVATVPPFTQT